MTSMDGSKYCTDDLSDGSYNSETSDYTEQNGDPLYSYRKHFGPIPYSPEFRSIGLYNDKLSSVCLSKYDLDAINRCGLTVEQVDDIDEIGSKLNDLEVLYNKSKLSKKIFKNAMNKKKPTEFDIYTMIEYQYQTVPAIYENKFDRRLRKKKKYQSLEKKYLNKYFPCPGDCRRARSRNAPMMSLSGKLETRMIVSPPGQEKPDHIPPRNRADPGGLEVHQVPDQRAQREIHGVMSTAQAAGQKHGHLLHPRLPQMAPENLHEVVQESPQAALLNPFKLIGATISDKSADSARAECSGSSSSAAPGSPTHSPTATGASRF